MRWINPLVLLAGVASYVVMWTVSGQRPVLQNGIGMYLNYGTHGIFFDWDKGTVGYWFPVHGRNYVELEAVDDEGNAVDPTGIKQLYYSVKAVKVITKQIIEDIESEHG